MFQFCNTSAVSDFQFVESMVKDLKMPIVLVRGSGREFVTIYS